jgi:hypothetical protein
VTRPLRLSKKEKEEEEEEEEKKKKKEKELVILPELSCPATYIGYVSRCVHLSKVGVISHPNTIFRK